MAIPEVDRSGWELRHCYKLHGLERSDHNSSWTMRQTAIYHSIDMAEGREFWLTIKANNEVRNRVIDGSNSLEAMQAARLDDLGSSFIACLATHLVTVDWCAEGWRWRINEIELKTRDIFVRITGTPLEPVADGLDFRPEKFVQSLSMRTGLKNGSCAPAKSYNHAHTQKGILYVLVSSKSRSSSTSCDCRASMTLY